MLILLVLFSREDNCWKVTDFGTASRATSSRQNTTHLSRGTASYRSPEILDSRRPKYNNKTDIFALGCIAYEILTGEKLFWDDYAILRYSTTGTLGSEIWWPEAKNGDLNTILASLERVVASMLETDHRRRPSARHIGASLWNIRAGIGSGQVPTPDGPPIQVRQSFGLY